MSGHGVTRETVALPGPRGILTGELAYGDQADRGAALLIGPHPYMGGTMDNNIISHLATSLAERGLVTMRFNYRDVAHDALAESMLAFWKTGHAPQDVDLVTESVAVREWLVANVGGPIVLVGYSFGAHAASHVIDEHTSHVVVIAPTVMQHELGGLGASRVPKLVIYSNDDFATTQLATETWFDGLAEPKAKIGMVECDHFFKDRESVVADHVARFLDTTSVPAEVA